MADQDDLDALIRGDIDLVRADFRKAQLTGFDIRGRDLSGAALEKAVLVSANLSNSKLSGAGVTSANFSKAIMKNAIITQTAIVSVDFSYANLSGSSFARSHFQSVNFTGANLSGANFSGAHFGDKVIFEDCIADNNTNFDRAEIFRPQSKNVIFSNYRFERGILHRIDALLPSSGSGNGAVPDIKSPEFNKIIASIASVQNDLDRLLSERSDNASIPGVGHNNPPDIIPIDRGDEASLKSSLVILKEAAEKSTFDGDAVKDAALSIKSISDRIKESVIRKLDIATDSFAQQFGKSAGDVKIYLGSWVVFSGHLEGIYAAISNVLRLALN